MKIVGILGPAGSGKSTVANYLVEKYGATRYAFGDPLKEIARRTLDFSYDQLYGSQATKEAVDSRYGFSPRWFMQRLGTEGIRSVLGEDFWWKYCLERIHKDKPALAVIDDVRFENEAAGILSVVTKSFVWRLESAGQSSADPTHQSEAEWQKAPYSHIIRPASRNLVALFNAVDDVAMACDLQRTRLVLR